jgi:hypothetical protein
MPLERKGQKLIFASTVFAVAISYPMLTIANKKSGWLHLPILYMYLFGLWLLFIIGISFIVDRKSRK